MQNHACVRSGSQICHLLEAVKTACTISQIDPSLPDGSRAAFLETRKDTSIARWIPFMLLGTVLIISYRNNSKCIYSDFVMRATFWYRIHMSGTKGRLFLHSTKTRITRTGGYAVTFLRVGRLYSCEILTLFPQAMPRQGCIFMCKILFDSGAANDSTRATIRFRGLAEQVHSVCPQHIGMVILGYSHISQIIFWMRERAPKCSLTG